MVLWYIIFRTRPIPLFWLWRQCLKTQSWVVLSWCGVISWWTDNRLRICSDLEHVAAPAPVSASTTDIFIVHTNITIFHCPQHAINNWVLQKIRYAHKNVDKDIHRCIQFRKKYDCIWPKNIVLWQQILSTPDGWGSTPCSSRSRGHPPPPRQCHAPRGLGQQPPAWHPQPPAWCPQPQPGSQCRMEMARVQNLPLMLTKTIAHYNICLGGIWSAFSSVVKGVTNKHINVDFCWHVRKVRRVGARTMS